MEYGELFPPQREVIESGLLDAEEHLLLNMATGSGKTRLAELAIAKTLRAGYKAIYLTPLRAIASQQYEQWRDAFPGARVGVFTGETPRTAAASCASSQLLIMTPERLDACMRNWRGHWAWLPDVGLLVIDEFHVLGQPGRGARLEGTITRLVRLNPFVRVIGLSATMPNAAELAAWLRGKAYGSRWRRVPVEEKILRFKAAKEKPELLLAEVRRCVSSGGRSLVFCNSRSRAQELSAFLLAHGVPAACHHAGLEREKRAAVERDFRGGAIRALVATSTLEMGLNLPARQVVIYDSYAFSEDGFCELPVWSFLQRAGRAGRPGLDETGEVILLLPRWGGDGGKYLRGECERVASQLTSRKSLREQLLVDVFAGYSRTRRELSEGFLPLTLYKRQHPEASVDGAIDGLVSAGFLTETTDAATGRRILRCALPGRLAAKLMLAPETVRFVRDACAGAERLYLFDLLLLAALSPDCTPVLKADYEELDALCAGVRTLQSSLLGFSVEELRKAYPDVPSTPRLLAGIKMAAICRALTEGVAVETLAKEHDVYDADVAALRENMIRLLRGIAAIASAADRAAPREDAPAEEKKGAMRAPELSVMLADMLQYGIGSELVPLTRLRGVGGKTARKLADAGYDALQKIADAEPRKLSRVPGIGKKLAAALTTEASELLGASSDAFYAEEPYDWAGGASERTFSVDPYRLRRSLELGARSVDGCRYRVFGGREEHLVRAVERGYVCDCADYEKNGGDCKHILCVRRAAGDAEVCETVKRVREDGNRPIREALPSLWYSVTAEEG